MITMGEMQISGMLTMMMLSVMLTFCVPNRSKRRSSFARARWMMGAGTGMIAFQFLLQYSLGFRQMGITQGVLLNLLLFMPASLLCSMSVLYILRQGRISRREWITSITICIVSSVLLLSTTWFDGIPIHKESTLLRMVEYVGAMLYALMQSYIFVRQYRAYKQLEHIIDEYFDRERHDLFGWMGWSMKTMAVLAFAVPLVIFMKGTPLVIFSIAYFFCIAYSTINLYSYGISEDIMRVDEAEHKGQNHGIPDLHDSDEKDNTNDNYSNPAVTEAVERWKESGAFREHNLTLSVVARQMGVSQRHLQEWLRHSEYEKLAGLVTQLRIDEAKRALKAHPDWSAESVADYCGFSSREYFHRTFRQITGMTPARYQAEN